MSQLIAGHPHEICLTHKLHTHSLRPLRIYIFNAEIRNITLGWQKNSSKNLKTQKEIDTENTMNLTGAGS